MEDLLKVSEITPYKGYFDSEDYPSPADSGVHPDERTQSRFSALEHHVNGRLAQSVERRSYTPEVAGSFPAPPTTTRQQRAAHRSEYLRNYRREWMRARRRSYFSGKSCDTCGSTEKLELHHRDPQQKISHSIWSWSADRRASELEKCVALCGVCHQGLTSLYHSSNRESLQWSVGASGIQNVGWYAPRRRWRVGFTVHGKTVNVGGGGFRNIVTARMAAESFRRSLSAHYAELNVRARIACIKQHQLFPVTEVQSCQ